MMEMATLSLDKRLTRSLFARDRLLDLIEVDIAQIL